MATLLVSNRLPVTVHVEGPKVTVEPSTGGLATAVGRVHARGDGRWIGWPGASPRGAAKAQLDEKLASLRCLGVSLSQSEVSAYYDGFSNGVLWPLFHYLLDKVDLDADVNFSVYRDVNRRFAETAARAYREGDTVWVHDYQLLLVPGFLRELLPEAKIGFFLHIPFPADEVFRILPWRAELLQSLLAADLVGFHTSEYRDYFRRAVERSFDVIATPEGIRRGDRTTRIGVFPIGIDSAAFASKARTPKVLEAASRLRAEAGSRRLVLGIDRLDYTKGLPRRLLAFERFLERSPGAAAEVQFIQVAVPSRERVGAYADLRRTVHELAGRIASKYGSLGTSPLRLVMRALEDDELLTLYAAADVMLVTPLRDGMNLVAKEYIASRGDDRGVLVLSEHAGAAKELKQALLVNPYDVGSVADAIVRALAMPETEQARRMGALRRHVETYDVHGWAERFLAALANARPLDEALPAPDVEKIVARIREHREVVLLLDYDGTLTRHRSSPELAVLGASARTVLTALTSVDRLTVRIVTGRGRTSIETLLRGIPVEIDAEHGLWRRGADGGWHARRDVTTAWRADVRRTFDVWCARWHGAFVEEKSATLVFHYRNVETARVQSELDILRRDLSAVVPADAELLEGSCVLEVRPCGVHKGLALEALPRDALVVVVGDDRTDEDLFRAARGAVTIKVGEGPTNATLRLPDVDGVIAFLQALARRLEA